MSELAPKTAALNEDLAPAAVVAAVPPWAKDSGVVKPVREVMSELAPNTAALSADLAPAAVVEAVPPLATARVPARVTTPVVAVDGVNPVVPAENDETTTGVTGAALVQLVPLEVSRFPDVLGNTELNPVPPLLPMIAALAVTDADPVPPWATESGVVRPVRDVMSPLAPRTAALSAALAADAVVPAVPPDAIGSAAPRVSEGM
jgi:hypothetical protein